MSVLKNLSSGIFGQGVTILIQLGMVPFFFSSWGADYYGAWLQVVAIPMLLAFGDFGFSSTISNKVTEIVATTGKYDENISNILYSGLVFLLCSGVFLVSISLFFLFFIDGLPTGYFDEYNVFLLMSLYFILSIFSTFFVNCGRSVGVYHRQLAIFHFVRLTEAFFVVLLLFFELGAFEVALTYVFIKFFGLLLLFYGVVVSLDLKRPSARNFRFSNLTGLWNSSLNAFLLPLSLALGLQLPLIYIGSVAGGAAVAFYNSARTLARMPLQISNVVNASFWGGVSHAFAVKDQQSINLIERKVLKINSIVGIASFFILFFSGRYIYSLWVGSGNMFLDDIFVVLAISGVFTSIWLSMALKYTATNRHSIYTPVYFLFVIVSLIMLFFLDFEGLYEVSLIMLVPEILIVTYLFFRQKFLTRV